METYRVMNKNSTTSKRKKFGEPTQNMGEKTSRPPSRLGLTERSMNIKKKKPKRPLLFRGAQKKNEGVRRGGRGKSRKFTAQG